MVRLLVSVFAIPALVVLPTAFGLGGKGANLADMTLVPLPVPPGFVIGAQAYAAFCDNTGLRGAVGDVEQSCRRCLEVGPGFGGSRKGEGQAHRRPPEVGPLGRLRGCRRQVSGRRSPRDGSATAAPTGS